MVEVRTSEIVLGALCALLALGLSLSLAQLTKTTERAYSYEQAYIRSVAKNQAFSEVIGNERQCDALRHEMEALRREVSPPKKSVVIKKPTIVEVVHELPTPTATPTIVQDVRSEPVLSARASQKGPIQ